MLTTRHQKKADFSATRRVIALALAFAGLGITGYANAQEGYPSKPVRLVVAYAAGGGTDIAARIFAESLSRVLKTPVVVENKAGASGNIGGEYVAKAAPDGYTLLFGAMANLAINPFLYKDMRYVPEKDFTPIAQIFDTGHVIVASPTSKFSNLGQMISEVKTHPGKYTFASAGAGSSTHVVGAMFAQATGAKLVHVPYKGNAPALVDVMAGQVDLMFDQVPNSAQYVKTAKVQALAVTSPKRVPGMPNVPTVSELGYPQLTILSWTGLFAPANLPADVAAKLSEATKAALSDPDTRAKLEKAGASPNYLPAKSMANLLHADSKRFAVLVQKAGIKVD